jgi:5-methylcytosine-specific restriction endonuclease McrA
MDDPQRITPALGQGRLALAEKGKWGHTIEVRLPGEVCAIRARKIAARETQPRPSVANLNPEDADFLAARALRQAIHAREAGRCFYCRRRTTPATRCLDHVVPRACMGSNSYSNLVSSCVECNSKKGERRAQDFLRWLYRDGRLESSEIKGAAASA